MTSEGGLAMPRGVLNTKQLAMIARVLDSYCSTYGIAEPIQREEVGARLIILFGQGNRADDDLMAALVRHESSR